MKLIFCKACNDVYNLSTEVEKSCRCKGTSGAYLEDGLHAWYSGKTAVPMGLLNNSLVQAIIHQPLTGMGKEFKAFVIPETCDTFEYRE